MNRFRVDVAITTQVLFTILLLVGENAQASATPRIVQTTVGNCNQSSLTINAPKTIDSQLSQDGAQTLSTIGPPCVVIQIDRHLNALENAQMQLLIAEHPTRMLMGPATLGKKLGETVSSIWVEVHNQSPYDVHGLRIDPAIEQRHASKANKTQTYLTSNLPGAVVSTKNLVLKGGESVQLLAATPSVIAKVLASVPNNWCLFDVGDQPTDDASEGYKEASLNRLKELSQLSAPVSDHALFQMIPILFTVQYSDIFGIVHGVPVSAYLRVASPDSTSVFYPSHRAYGPLECHNH